MHRPDKERFQRPYVHKMQVDGSEAKLTIHQSKFTAEGFASTGERAAHPSRRLIAAAGRRRAPGAGFLGVPKAAPAAAAAPQFGTAASWWPSI